MDSSNARPPFGILNAGQKRPGCIFGVDAMEAFTQHYRAALALDETELPYWELYAALGLARKHRRL